MKSPKYVAVAFPIPVRKEFHYFVPPSLRPYIQPGVRVKAKFNHQIREGFVTAPVSQPEVQRLEQILEVLDKQPLLQKTLLQLTHWMAKYYQSSWGEALQMALPASVKNHAKGRKELYLRANPLPSPKETIQNLEKRSPQAAKLLKHLLHYNEEIRAIDLKRTLKISQSPIHTLHKKGLIQLNYRTDPLEPYAELPTTSTPPPTLNKEQTQVLQQIWQNFQKNKFQVALLHGITGSGKTEIYLQLIEKILPQKQSAIVLIPEISLTPQTMKRFKSRFGENIAVLHSNLSPSQRAHQWKRIQQGNAHVVIGPRSAVFAPVQNLGLIIVDEEHETSFKEQSSPAYNGRDLAIMRCLMENAKAVLGSATPSLISYHNALKGKYQLYQLHHRATSQPLPNAQIIDMRYQKHHHLFSEPLLRQIRQTLQKGEQIILFLNRRGFSTFIACKRCGFVLKCKHCDITLTFHKKYKKVLCHYCAYEHNAPQSCPDCLANTLQYLGEGTEKIENFLQQQFPHTPIARLDSDVMQHRQNYIQILENFAQQKIQILVGTQMIAKGLDFPHVTLVGVINADVGLHMPDFSAAERTFQLLTQVAGRAGRGTQPGRVLIQTYLPDHYSITCAANHNYQEFAQKELEFRQRFLYPPYCRLFRLVVSGKNLQQTNQTAQKIKSLFPKNLRGSLLGPAPCPISQINGEYRFQILGKFPNCQEVQNALSYLPQRKFNNVKLHVDVDPVGML
ncbi:MAG: primosomal protein N' [Planctomycetota bacterium]|nr:MAG: primosomal protein N' [Planctomycetota bacterium]